MSDERRLEVLRAIVRDYVSTREPVGSRALVERHALGVSPATIRNDMAALEESGYIAQPHTSAGRVPTDKGYRLFVDRLSTLKPLTPAERRAIEHLLDEAVDLDDVVDRTVRLLAQITHQVAVVQYPSLRRTTLRHIELVPMAPGRLLVVMIMDTGRVEQRTIELAADAAPDEAVVAELRARLNAVGAGRRMPRLGVELEMLPTYFAPADRPFVDAVNAVIAEALAEETEERIVMAGTANLARSDTDFPRTISPVLEALEEQVVLLRLLSEMALDAEEVRSERGDGISVRIGHENRHAGLAETSIVASGYGGVAADDAVAYLGVLGPTRMDYPTTMASVRAVARYLSRALGG
ncbi:heat-inducible transcription repressor HrcA [Beutenbergia cavernae DSM 12333]|uniref:Heat-inducible transcription repressor HrcA n=1 Tax=Beutenbergia cavernae (strain ATCC BAA-8 / DSM 12333 / CCUG 43141 / JCM 11478 / NBRC 16432 / NCIMB 13614 / HKI 0122) TaxID=471853 RepID=HRCA_BEUC1|nr:heat-inducible transcriptional repressor HrcA [Beutenbergia cavernae]C5C491.1 RecName: Full=Heat-inducible transcription repressor HrcA [Beutenbergia cavernae DSM 12333]ACQ80004.1 heat-inducible transcription repressor HrcA [Beutenbergia cavernae DSM 12333]